VADPARRLADLPLLTEAEQRTLARWNATQAAYPHTQCFHQLFEAQAARTPDAIAIVFDGPPTTDPFGSAAPEPVEGQGRRRPPTDHRR
jgi:non-ribosomal peptide synthetase component F